MHTVISRTRSTRSAPGKLAFIAASAIALALLLLLQGDIRLSGNSPAGFSSDEFDGASLDPAWTFVDPLGDSSVSVSGGSASILSPGGNNHDFWVSGVTVPRIMQSVTDGDFELEVKFDSAISQKYQLQGIIARQDASNYLRFGSYSDGADTRAFVARIDPVAGTHTIHLHQVIVTSPVSYLQLSRAGGSWTLKHSTDGSSWVSLTTINSSFILSEIGVYSGNVGTTSHTADVDYFRDIAAPTPTANDDAYSIDEDASLVEGAPGVLSNDTGDGSETLTAALDSGPANGSVALQSDGSFTYTPDGDFNGPDSFTYTASGIGGTSAPGTVSITVNPVNDVPVAQDQSVQVEQDTLLAVTLVATDADGEALTYTVLTLPVNGTLSGSAPDLTYSPDPGFFGGDSFTFRASDATTNSNTATVDIMVFETNEAPVAVDDVGSTDEDTVLNVPAPGVLANDSDADLDPLTAELVTGTSNGALILNPDGSYAYTPDPDFNGSDSFTYRATDGQEDSPPATVALTVNAVNDPPVADPQTVTTNADIPVAVTLTASDVENEPLSYDIATGPSSGSLSGTAPNVTYTPTPGFIGQDSFTFTASDPSDTGGPATVQVDVLDPDAIFSDEFDGASLLPGWTEVDPLGDSTISVSGGALSISVPPGTAHDIWSSGVTAPRIMQQAADEDLQVEVKLDSAVTDDYQLQGILAKQGTDTFIRFGNYGDGTGTNSIVALVSGGSATILHSQQIAGASTSYLRVSRSGDSWTFERSLDGITWNVLVAFTLAFNLNSIGVYAGNISGPAHTAIVDYFRNTLPPPVDPPVANADAYSVDEDDVLAIAAPGVLANDTDPEDEPLSAILQSPTASGSLSLGSDGSFTYTPAADFNGQDSFTYRASDGANLSGTATVTITVDPIADAPVAYSQLRQTSPDTPIEIVLGATDADGDPITAFSITDPPGDGTLTGTAPNLTYTPDPGFTGPDAFQFTATDGTLTSDPVFAAINVSPPVSREINFFYGNEQQFNNLGRPQVWADVLGNVTEADGLNFMRYMLNGGPVQPLNIGPDSRRLFKHGDFVVQLPFDDLVVGDNQLVVTAEALNGALTEAVVTLNYPGPNVWPDTYSIDWSSVTDIQDVIQVVDGEWQVGPNGVTTAGVTAYDRLLTVGDESWTDFSATVPVTVHDYDPAGNFCCGVALFIRWTGHTNDPDICIQPICGWEPFGNDAWYQWDETGGHSAPADSNPNSLVDNSGLVLQPGVTYMFKVEVETVGTDNVYRKKVWKHGDPEPVDWMAEAVRNDGALTAGSLLLVAHHTDVTFGDIQVTPVGASPGSPPVGQDDNYVVLEDGTLIVPGPGVLANDSDPDSDPISAALISGTASGSLALNYDGSFTYTPNAQFSGQDSFVYRAVDASGISADTTVTIDVTAVNDPPTADSQSVSVEDGTPEAITLTGSDPDGDPLSFNIVSGPSHGSLSGTVPDLTYSTDPGYVGPDALEFTVTDGVETSATATVHITATPVNDPPVTAPDAYASDEDVTLNVAAPGVLGNDSDPDGNPMTATVVAGPTNGSLTLDPDGSFEYVPDADFFGQDSFTYDANDPYESTGPETVTITIDPVNDTPVADSADVSTFQDIPLDITLTASDAEGEPLTFSVATQPSNGSLSGTAPNLTYTPDAGYVGPDSFTFNASDGSSTSSDATVQVSVQPFGTLFSDEFNGSALSAGWTFVDPVGDSSVSVGGGAVSITAPAGSNHDFWVNGVNSPRIMQEVADTDFRVEARFDSAPGEQFQLQGIVAKQSDETFLRFGNYSDGGTTYGFVAQINPATGERVVINNAPVAISASTVLRVTRSGNSWTFERSIDEGATWQIIVAFNRVFSLDQLGLYSGNLNGPTHVAIVDYFRDTTP